MRLRATVALFLGILIILPAPAGAIPKGTKVQTYQGGVNFPIDMAMMGGDTLLIAFARGVAVVRVSDSFRPQLLPVHSLALRSTKNYVRRIFNPEFHKNVSRYPANAPPITTNALLAELKK